MKIFISFLILIAVSSFAIAQQVEFKNEQVIQLGKIQQGQTAEGKIEFVNTGTAAVEIESIKPSCGCTAVTPERMVYESGETAVIPFSIKTDNFSGLIRKSIKVTFKNVEPRTYSFFAEATVVTDLSITPKYINFAQVNLDSDTTITEYFEVENTTEQPIEISKIHTDSKYIKVSPESMVVPGGKSHLIRIDFTPTEAGRHNTQVYLESNLKTDSQKTLPVFIYVRDPLKGS